MKKWQYVRLTDETATVLPIDFEEYGSRGWELVSVIWTYGGYREYYFKREKTDG